MKNFLHKLLGSAIAFSLVFCIVIPVQAESVSIINTVYSYSNSGNQGQDGVNGTDGESGRNGAPGSDGQSGSDGHSVVNGSSSASIRIETTINGETVVEWETQKDADTEVVIATSTGAGVPPLSEDDRLRLSDLLLKIRLILLNYVFNI